jgi:DNA-binding CsgD family transcriptional regulator
MDWSHLTAGALIDSMDGYASVLDCDGAFQLVNQNQSEIMGCPSRDFLIGRSYDSIKNLSPQAIENFIAQDQSIMHSQKPLRYLSYRPYSNGQWHLLIGDKSSILDDEGRVIGVFSHAKDFTHSQLIDLGRFLLNANKTHSGKAGALGFDCAIIDQDTTSGLSAKEMMVLFYILRGKTAKNIASVLHRSEKTINFHIDSLKNKFNVQTKSHLIECAISKGLMNMLPDSVLKMVFSG